ncbi:MAG: DMT family transporter [Micropepsaceae bacterium]
MRGNVTLQALAFGFAGVALFSALDAAIKQLGLTEHTFVVTFGRYLFALPFVATFWYRAGRPAITRDMWRAHALRGTIMAVAATLFFWSLTVVPLAEAITLSFLAPLIMPFLASAMLGERLRPASVAASVLGFAGAVVAVMGGSGAAAETGRDPQFYNLGIAALLVFSVAYAYSAILLRARAGRDGSAIVGLLSTLIPGAIMAAPALAFGGAPAAANLPLFVFVGMLGAVSTWLLTAAYARAEAQVLAPLEFTALIWAAAFGYAFFNEVPRVEMWLGAAIIVGACLWSGWTSARAQPAELGPV